MREYDDLPYIVIERRESGVAPFLWGALLGAGAALLLAPRSGAEMQAELRERADRIRATAEDRVNGVRDSVMDTVGRTRDRVQDRFDSVRDEIESRADQARSAVEAGRRAAREARSDLERRMSDVRESYRAASDAVHGRPGESPIAPEEEVVVTEVVVEEIELPGEG